MSFRALDKLCYPDRPFHYVILSEAKDLVVVSPGNNEDEILRPAASE